MTGRFFKDYKPQGMRNGERDRESHQERKPATQVT